MDKVKQTYGMTEQEISAAMSKVELTLYADESVVFDLSRLDCEVVYISSTIGHLVNAKLLQRLGFAAFAPYSKEFLLQQVSPADAERLRNKK